MVTNKIRVEKMNKVSRQTKKPFYKQKKFLWTTGSVIAVILVVMIAFKVSPWPGALVIRAVFDSDSTGSKKALEKHTPSKPVTVLINEQYEPANEDTLLDVYFPTDTKEGSMLPVIIWTHGGAWLSGSKADRAPYFKLLAAEGYTVIAPDYSLAPGKKYPTPLKQLTTMYAFIKANKSRFHANIDSIFLAGDSAGAQISSQMAAIITNSRYAAEVGIAPSLTPDELDGVILFCGIYKMHGLIQPPPELPKIIGWGDDIAVWSYAGTKNFSDPVIRQMSPYYHATSDFPPTFISGGNGDPLTDDQSKPFADLLKNLGVKTTTLFFPADHQPKLPHEYQFNLDNGDGQKALSETVDFVRQFAR